MKPKTIMLLAGEASGDLLAAELVAHLRRELAGVDSEPDDNYQPLYASLAPRFIGAGGPRMAAAGVHISIDMTAHSVVGISDVLRNLFEFRRIFRDLFRLARNRQPEAIVCVDFSGFNRRFAHAIRRHVHLRQDLFNNWNPRLIQYVSPQVWASRERRAYKMAADYDLLLSIFPFEREWYAKRVPAFRVEFVGHPILDRYQNHVPPEIPHGMALKSAPPQILLLPGSRRSELQRHLPTIIGALAVMRTGSPNLQGLMLLPDDDLAQQAKALGLPADVRVQIGNLPEAMQASSVALASTGTVTLECAYFGLPTVALYKTSWTNYQIAKRVVTVNHLAMPNLLAGETVFPEFIQGDATPEKIGAAALQILRDPAKQADIKTRLKQVISRLGTPGAAQRAARAIVQLLARA